MMVARLWSCRAPATISEAEADEELIRTTMGTFFATGVRPESALTALPAR